MQTLLLIVSLSAVSHLLLWLPPLWRFRQFLTYFGIGLQSAAAVIFIIAEPSIWSIVFATVAGYVVVSLYRILLGRMQPGYLRQVTLRSSLLLTGLQLALVSAAALDSAPDMTLTTFIYMIAGVQLLVGLVLISSTSRHLKTTKTLQATTSYTDASLPSVSVLIPARNETDDLRHCLDALTASNYPKLEIIVLDDCSQDKHTPEIIRSFAHAGVRFLAGDEPAPSWLAKNYAYQQLADAASGDYLLFCGVDLNLTPGAIRELITTMLEKDKQVLSILPQNVWPRNLGALLVQPMRYAWELSLPRRFFNRPPILSTCWIIRREFLRSSGSFRATSRSIVPEGYFARAAARLDGYSFLRSNLLQSNKSPAEQLATAVRLRYPQLHRRLELVWFVSLLELVGIVLPLPMIIIFGLSDHLLAGVMAGFAYACIYAVFLQVSGVMYGRPVWLGFLLIPFVAAYDIAVLNYSLYRYEFREVRWKARNICLPVMRFDQPPVNPARRS